MPPPPQTVKLWVAWVRASIPVLLSIKKQSQLLRDQSAQFPHTGNQRLFIGNTIGHAKPAHKLSHHHRHNVPNQRTPRPFYSLEIRKPLKSNIFPDAQLLVNGASGYFMSFFRSAGRSFAVGHGHYFAVGHGRSFAYWRKVDLPPPFK